MKGDQMTEREIESAIERAEKKMNQARQDVLKNEAFFAYTLMGLVTKMGNGQTMATNGDVLFWSWDFVEACQQPTVTFVILHEVLHVVLHHCTRGRHFADPRLFNIAADHVVNIIIVRLGLKKTYTDQQFRRVSRGWLAQQPCRGKEYRLPEDAVMDPRFAGMTLEEVYHILETDEAANKPDQGDQGDQGDDENGSGNGDDASDDADDTADGSGSSSGGDDTDEDDNASPDGSGGDGPASHQAGPGEQNPCDWGWCNQVDDSLTEAEIDKIEQEVDSDVALAETFAKTRGQMPVTLAESIAALNAPSQAWDEVLKDMMSDQVVVDETFAKQNRRHIDSDLVMPGEETDGLFRVIVMTDESGSVSSPEFTQFMSDFASICDELEPQEVIWIPFDSAADFHIELEQGDEPELIRRRRGGTDFRAPFAYAEAEDLLDDADVVIVFTDGEANRFPEIEPECPVIWATTYPFYNGNPPFGEVINVRFK